MPEWADVRDAFDDDGLYREIHVFDTGPFDWQRLLAAVPRSPWDFRYSYDEQQAALPVAFSAALSAHGSPLLVIDRDGLRLHCRFLRAAHIEFDLLPRAVQNAAALERLLDFMRWLCRVLDKPVTLFQEGADLFETDPGPSHGILRVTPES